MKKIPGEKHYVKLQKAAKCLSGKEFVELRESDGFLQSIANQKQRFFKLNLQ